MQNPKDVHFNAKGYAFLGDAVAKAIESSLHAPPVDRTQR